MSFHPFLNDVIEGAKAIVSALAPAALGSFVAQIHEKGLSWRDRLLGYLNGILVSYYVTLGLGAWLGFDQFIAQAVGFVLGMIAFKSTPQFIAAASDAVTALPGAIRDRIAPKKGDS